MTLVLGKIWSYKVETGFILFAISNLPRCEVTLYNDFWNFKNKLTTKPREKWPTRWTKATKFKIVFKVTPSGGNFERDFRLFFFIHQNLLDSNITYVYDRHLQDLQNVIFSFWLITSTYTIYLLLLIASPAGAKLVIWMAL